jgi:hypothetical protein
MSDAHDLLKQCLEAFRAIPKADDSRKLLKRHGVRPAAYAGNASHILAGWMVKELEEFLIARHVKIGETRVTEKGK